MRSGPAPPRLLARLRPRPAPPRLRPPGSCSARAERERHPRRWRHGPELTAPAPHTPSVCRRGGEKLSTGRSGNFLSAVGGAEPSGAVGSRGVASLRSARSGAR